MNPALRQALERAILEAYWARGWPITLAEVSLLADWVKPPTFALWCYRASLPHLPGSASLARS